MSGEKCGAVVLGLFVLFIISMFLVSLVPAGSWLWNGLGIIAALAANTCWTIPVIVYNLD